MKKVKDYFSGHARLYAQYRPHYPEALYEYLLAQVQQREAAWDCGTGNGQVAGRLADSFGSVYATDISEQQMAQAVQRPNIRYTVSRAEQTDFSDNSFDLITVAQALHWFDFPAFFGEVQRTARDQGLLAVWGYKLLTVSPAADGLLHDFYAHTLGPYWAEERTYIEQEFENIAFPFADMATRHFEMKARWNRQVLEGYLHTWSSVQKYIRQKGEDPVPALMQQLDKKLLPADFTVTFPVFMKTARIHK